MATSFGKLAKQLFPSFSYFDTFVKTIDSNSATTLTHKSVDTSTQLNKHLTSCAPSTLIIQESHELQLYPRQNYSYFGDFI